MQTTDRGSVPTTDRRGSHAARLLALCLLTLPVQASFAEDASAEQRFDACVERLTAEARRAGISDATLDSVLANVRRVERVIELDRKQPEFTQTFSGYYTARVTPERVRRGRELLAEHRKLLARVQRDTGVPAHYLVAFWGLETNFGSYFGKIPVPDALATLACDPRRSTFFTGELIAALTIIDAGDVAPADMVGSWAGAMGHVQFLPSVFLAHAVDADGDGRRDLWGSIADAMTSAGRYLERSGWQTGLRWGRQVRLPDGFDFSLAGRDRRQPLTEWAALGVTDAWGRPLARFDIEASVLVPAGHRGPAYIVYRNFDVILKWNRSEYYALAVGRLADQLAGGEPLDDLLDTGAEPVTRDEVLTLQASLNTLGYDAGAEDGIFGGATRRALSRFQQERGLVADGHLDAEAVVQVREAAPAVPR